MTASYSAVTAFELWIGQLSSDEAAFYEGLFALIEEVPLTAGVARTAGEWLRSLPPSVSERLIRDAMVAASATERGESIYTRNIRDFRRFASASVETY